MTMLLTPAGLASYRKTTETAPVFRNDPNKSRKKGGANSNAKRSLNKKIEVNLNWGKK